MRKYFYLLAASIAFAGCSKKNDPPPQRPIVATIEVGVDPVLNITETIDNKTTQVYQGPADNPYKFTAPVGASITIVADAQSDGFEAPDLVVTDNGVVETNQKVVIDLNFNLHSSITFTVK